MRYTSLLLGRSATNNNHLGSIPVFSVGLFPGGVIPGTSKLVLQSIPCWRFIGSDRDWSARCLHVTERDRKFDLIVLSRFGSTCIYLSVPETHQHVAGTLSNQHTTTTTAPLKKTDADKPSPRLNRTDPLSLHPSKGK